MRRIHLLVIGIFIGTSLWSQGYDSLNVSLLFHWSDPSIPPAQIHANNYNEVWGYEKNGQEYAIIGTTLGTHFFDVTDPLLSTEVAFVQGAVSGSQIIHRDMKTYADHLFIVADEGLSTMQVIDLQYLPDSVAIVYDSSQLLYRAHNIFIDTTQGRLYTCGGNSDFAVYDISTPSNPSLLMDCEVDLPWWNGSVGYVHDAYVNDHVAYLNAENALYVVDFSDLNNVTILGSLAVYPDQGYNHSGWLNDAGTHYAMCDETHGTQIKMLDVTDLTDIQVTSLFGSDVDTALSIVHNVIFRDNVLHASYYHDGYWLWDTSDPSAPFLLGYYDTSQETHATNYKGAWGVYPLLPSGIVLVSDMQEGLFIFDVSAALSVPEVGTSDKSEIHIWPNPNSGSLQFRIPHGSFTHADLEVYDILGNLVHRERVSIAYQGSEEFLDISGLPSGMYQLSITNGKQRYSSIFVKQ